MLIALDVGNTSINIGFFIKSRLFIQKIDTYPLLSSAQYLSLINKFIREKNIDKKPEGIIISSVVPGHTGALKRALKKLARLEPVIIDCNIETGLKFNIPNPGELGSDRIANAAAAYEFYKCAVAVVDFGTATTISVVGEDADYIGGAIMPGINLMNKVLAKGASKLSEVQIEPPNSALGVDTAKCIQSGLFYGTAGAVERLLKEIEKEADLDLEVVVTGGHGGMISKFLKRKHNLMPGLTLHGLKIIYTKNKNA
jgi:type III pantothenate kinase